MATVSICMIVKNEEKILERSLNSIKDVVDEIIITDTGSDDRTVEIAKKFTDKIHFFKWINDFSAAYNFSSKFSTCDYILKWDADFFARPEFIPKILSIKKKRFYSADLVLFNWNIDFGDDGKPTKSMRRYFIYKRGKFHWESPIHSHLVANKDIKKVKRIYVPDIEIDHLKDPVEKKHRYSQTARILKRTLEKDPKNPRLLFFYAEGLLFGKDYKKALFYFLKYLENAERKSFEKLIAAVELVTFCYLNLNEFSLAKEFVDRYYGKYKDHPKFILAYADVLAVVNLKKAKKYYERYLEAPVKREDYGIYDFERHYIHPRLMLGEIYRLGKSKRKCKLVLNEVIEKTHSFRTRKLAQSRLYEKEKNN